MRHCAYGYFALPSVAALREAHSKRVELTSGLSVGMSVPMFLSIYLCLFVSVCQARGVCRANQQSFWDAKRR